MMSPYSKIKDSPTSLEDVLQQLNRKNIKINRQERLHNNIILYSVLNTVLKLMRNTDKLFHSMKPQLAYMGSYFDGLRVGHPTEFDINVVLKIPVNYDKIVLDSTDAKYDYTHIMMPSEFRRLCINPETAEKGFRKTAMWCDRSYRLSVTKFRSWMQSVVDAALMQLPLENGKRMLQVESNCFGIKCKLAGPANNLTIYHGKKVIDIDLVPTFSFKLPKKPVNCRVDFTKIQFKHLKEYFVVPKPSTDDFGWRLSFPFQERLIIEDKNNLKCVIKILKLLRDTQGFKQIASYHIKTLFMWEATEKCDVFWKRKSLAYLVIYMLTKLKDALACYSISNFWCPGHNLLIKIKPKTCTNWSNRLRHIINFIENHKNNNPQPVIDFFIQKS